MGTMQLVEMETRIDVEEWIPQTSEWYRLREVDNKIQAYALIRDWMKSDKYHHREGIRYRVVVQETGIWEADK